MTKLSTFPGVVGGGADDTVAVQAAFNSGAKEIEYDIDICHGTIYVPNGVKKIFGWGKVKQYSGNSRIFEMDGVEDLWIEKLTIHGNYSQGQMTSSSANDGILIKNSFGVRVEGCTFRYIQNIPIHFMGCVDCTAHDNRIWNCGLGIYTRGGKTLTITSNKIHDTLFDPSVFTIAISLESTDGHSYGIPITTIINDNMISGFNNAQGIMAHSGVNIIFGTNVVDGAVIGLSVNPFNTTDEVSRIIAIGNHAIGPVSLPGYSGGNDMMIFQGGPASGGGMTPSITDLIVGFNTTTNGNRAEGAANQGAMRVGYTKRANFVGNTGCTAKGNGLVIAADERSFNASNNIFEEVMENAGVQNGVLVMSGGVTGNIDNLVTNMTGANAVGVKVNGSNPNLRVSTEDVINVTTPSTGSWGGAPSGDVPSKEILSGTSCDLTGVEVVYFNHSTPTTVDTWIGVVPGKLYKFVFKSEYTTIGRSNAWLHNSTSYTGGWDDVMLIEGRTATTIRQAAPISVNG